MNATPLLDVSDLARRYGDRDAVHQVDLTVARGEVLGLLGLNGAGKTTTLRMICGTLAPSRGSIRINGVDLLDAPLLAKQSLGYLPEIPPLHPDTSVIEYLRYAAMLRRLPGRDQAAAVKRAMARCGLSDVSGRLVRNLSKGYQQRVGIAQAIVHEPALIVLDEPTAGLDPRQVSAIRSLISELRERHAVIFSSHILPEVQSTCDRVVILHEGRQVYTGEPEAREDGSLRLLLRFARPPAAEDLARIAGVHDVNAAGAGAFSVTVGSELDIDALVARAVEADWGLREAVRHRRTLEQVFLELTTGEAAA
ncbi:MAG: ABC transporter ATP-binding protein [Aquisalimonadaceae bacterium]